MGACMSLRSPASEGITSQPPQGQAIEKHERRRCRFEKTLLRKISSLSRVPRSGKYSQNTHPVAVTNRVDDDGTVDSEASATAR
jgi:hypothetical protein